MYSRVYFSLLLAFALGIVLVSSAPVDPRSQLAESFGKARRKFSIPKVSSPSKPPPAPPAPPKPAAPPAPAKPPVGVTEKPSVAPPVSTKPVLAPSISAKPSITSAASPPASSAASSAVLSVASSSTSLVASSVASSAAPSIASSAASSSASSAVSSSASAAASSSASLVTSSAVIASSASSAVSSSASSAASSSASLATSAVASSSASSAASSSASSASSSSSSAAASASSCPLPQTNAVRSTLARRAGITSGTDTPVCGIPFRLGTLQNACKANAISFTEPLTPLTKNTNTAGTLPTGTQCDHALELQALKFAMEQSGACTAIDAIIKAGGVTNPSAASQKQSLLSNMFDQINGQGNAFSLDTNVNGAKKLVVQAGLPQGAGCTASPSTELKKAINAYFTDPSINGPTRALATTLDGLANTAVNTAATNAQAAINCKDGSTTRLQNAKNSALQAVTAGKALYTGPTAMATAWANVLACANSLAA